MARFSILGLVLIIFTASLQTAWSQQNQAGQAGTAATAGQAGSAPGTTPAQAGAAGTAFRPGTSSAAGAAIPGQSGTFSDFGPAGQRQGQFTPSGQPVHGRATGQATTQTFVPFGAGVPVINRAPFFNPGYVPAFSQPGVPQNQFNQINVDAGGGDNQPAALPPNVGAGQGARVQAAGAQPQGIGRLTSTVTAPASRRYYQLNWQQLGYSPFTDPIFQRELRMSAQQQQDFQLLANRWDQKIRMLELYEGASAALTAERYAELRRESRELINALLTPNQERRWPELLGQASDVAVASDNSVDDSEDDRAPFR